MAVKCALRRISVSMPNLLLNSLLLIAVFLLPAWAHAQAGAGPIRPAAEATTVAAGPYPDTPEGLRQLLTDVLAAAKDGDRDTVTEFVRDMDIPNYEKWFAATFGEDRGESWAGPYGDNLDHMDEAFVQSLLVLAESPREVLTRKVNDNPQPGQGFESALLQSLRRPADIFFAEWKTPDTPKGAHGDPIGYFLFIDGKFRWNSTIADSKVLNETSRRANPSPRRAGASEGADTPSTPGRNGTTYPSCVSCPTPDYPKEARADDVEGVVILKLVVQPNGRARDIEVVQSLGSVFDHAATEAVWNWIFKPATNRDGKQVSTVLTIEVNFRVAKR